MNIKNSIKVLNILNILLLISGVIYIYLSSEYMGFERDLYYREYLLKKDYLIYFNLTYVGIFWIIMFLLSLKRILKKFSYNRMLELIIYIILSIITFLYQSDIYISTFIFALLNIFGFIRVILSLIEKYIKIHKIKFN